MASDIDGTSLVLMILFVLWFCQTKKGKKKKLCGVDHANRSFNEVMTGIVEDFVTTNRFIHFNLSGSFLLFYSPQPNKVIFG
jgi:hypothetical protein